MEGREIGVPARSDFGGAILARYSLENDDATQLLQAETELQDNKAHEEENFFIISIKRKKDPTCFTP
jgi:hypothetical protein